MSYKAFGETVKIIKEQERERERERELLRDQGIAPSPTAVDLSAEDQHLCELLAQS